MFETLVKTCATKESASDSDIGELLKRDIPTTRNGQCLNACILESTGIVSVLIFRYF